MHGARLETTTGANGEIVALAADMLFASRIRGAATAAGVNVRMARSPDDAARAIAAGARRLLLDLDLRGPDPVALIERLRADPATAGVEILAFVSHVREDRIAAARAAGATRVLARSAFVRDLPAILTAPFAGK